jgi:hypothetical protein
LFPSGGNFVATSFTVGVDFFPPGPGFSPLFDAYLYSNFQSQSVTGTVIISGPGMEIAEIGQALQAPSSPGLVTFTPPFPLNLSSGSLYWVILTPNNPLTFVTWDNNSLEVDGSLLTPEPATLGLLGLALPIIIALRKKRPSKP